jgi:uncharacterized protein YsxB (DUF464 family)
MIRIFSYRCGGKYRLYVTGHADFAPGNDIVCAGVSALVGALVQYARQSPACRHLRCHVQKGEVFLSCRGGLGAGFDITVGGLSAIAASYPAHVRVQSTVAE